jgi:transcription antitermination factor NusG
LNDTSENRWYVLRVRPRHEKVVAERLSDKYETFLPLLKRYNQWSDRVKLVETPLFSGYLFVKTSIKNKYYILEEQGISSFVQFGDKPAIIHDNEILAIKLMLEQPETLKINDGYAFSKGESIQVNRGVFAGIKGSVINTKNKSRLFVTIEQLGKIISVEIDSASIEKVRKFDSHKN